MKKRESKYWKLIIKVVGEQIYKWKKSFSGNQSKKPNNYYLLQDTQRLKLL